MNRRHASIAVIALVVVILFVFVPNVVLVVFAGVLVGAMLHGGGRWIGRRVGVRTGIGIVCLIVLILLGLGIIGTFTASAIAEQFDDLVRELPRALETLTGRIEQYDWAHRVMERLNPGILSAEGGLAASAVTSTFGALGSFVIILFVGVYLAVDPDLYERGIIRLLAPSARPRGRKVLARCASTLQNWLAAQLMAMTLVGSLTALGLWAVGVPLAIILGLIAGLLAFIPNIGPVLAILPALILTFPQGWEMLAWVLIVYLSVQALESYVITPLIQQEKVSMPPVLVIGMQLLFGVLFGFLGLALAMPLAALGKTLTEELYIKDYLERENSGIDSL